MSFSTDNRMADLLDLLPSSSEVKVVRQGQVTHKIWYGFIVSSTAQYVSLKTRIEIMGCFGMFIDSTASRSCVRVKFKVVYEKTNAFQNTPLS